MLSSGFCRWPEKKLDKEFQPYSSRKDELSVLDGCILWASRVVIPPPGQKLLLDELHENHPGKSKMKALARSYVWWPGIQTDIENMVNSCPVCQETRASPAPAPLHPWEWHGPGSISTSLVRSTAITTSYWWTPTPSGLMCT